MAVSVIIFEKKPLKDFYKNNSDLTTTFRNIKLSATPLKVSQ